MDEQMVAVGGRALQVSSVGSGPVTLVILSGSNILFPGLEYAPLADALREWYSVLIPSKFGYGFSDLTEAPRDVDTVVEEYRRVLAALKHPFPVVLAAHSMGFLEALHWASKYPEEISALVGLDPATPDAYQNMDLASVPTLFLLSNGKGTPLPKEEWRMCARNYLSAFSTSSFHLFELPHDLYRQRPKEIADTVHRFLLDHL